VGCMTSFDPVCLGHPSPTISSDPVALGILRRRPHQIHVYASMITFYVGHCTTLRIPFEDFMMMNMMSLTWLGIFYGNNIYAISAIILRSNLMIFMIITIKLDDFYDHKYNTYELSTTLTLAQFYDKK
jgi:hypothetical protein